MSETSPTEPHQNFRAVSQGERKNYQSENVIFNSSVRANSKEICEEMSFPSFFREMLMSAFLLRFKVNYLEKVRGYPYFSLWIPIALAMVYFFRVVGSISAALSCLVYPPREEESSGEERGLLSRTAAGNRVYLTWRKNLCI